MAKTHSVYYPLYNDKTHFIYLITGSRASGKSFSASQFIERLTFEYNAERKIAHKILYTRYTMVSAAISVIPEVKEKIEIDGTQDYFKNTKTDIVNVHVSFFLREIKNKSTFSFRSGKTFTLA